MSEIERNTAGRQRRVGPPVRTPEHGGRQSEPLGSTGGAMPCIEAAAIRPAVRGKADFHSWQLYRWVKERPYGVQIWRGTWNAATGIDRERPVLYIGHMDITDSAERWFHGRMLRNLCLLAGNLDGYAYGPAFDTAHWEEITREWWEQYMRIGVCAIHGDRAHHWEERGDTRSCSYCGKQEQRVIETIGRAVWVPTT
ncbi:hypothetical protein [Thioalkalivibrio thiocyanodenitrificans]|uniref:hypothetical protein n=1 Tax=Thioalkalivibrio thiocyanodenitrificans TaxID=243063 RepID=UPI0003741248|nr:hypothetical protein [Thioalkalivibrio thiocyanodenitrificans]